MGKSEEGEARPSDEMKRKRHSRGEISCKLRDAGGLIAGDKKLERLWDAPEIGMKNRHGPNAAPNFDGDRRRGFFLSNRKEGQRVQPFALLFSVNQREIAYFTLPGVESPSVSFRAHWMPVRIMS